MSENVAAWCGKPIDECTRDELVEAINVLANQLAEYRTPAKREAMALGQVEQIRREEHPAREVTY